MHFKLNSLLILLTAACFLLTALMTLLHAGPDHHYEIGISLLGSIVAAIILVTFIVADERHARVVQAKDADAPVD